MCTSVISPIAAPPASEEGYQNIKHEADMWCSRRFKNFHFNPLFDPVVATLPDALSGSICLFDGRSFSEGHTLVLEANSQVPLVIPEDIVVRSILALHAGVVRDFVWTDTLCDQYAVFTASTAPIDGSIRFSSTAFATFKVPHAAFSAQAAGRFRGANSCTCPGVESVVYAPDLAKKTPLEVLELLSRGEL